LREASKYDRCKISGTAHRFRERPLARAFRAHAVRMAENPDPRFSQRQRRLWWDLVKKTSWHRLRNKGPADANDA
jgi:hypothetical protein